MSKIYILVEGVNIYDNVLDTNQLSIIRGTSFLFKQAIDEITETFKVDLIPISTGASSGLYYLSEKVNIDDVDAEKLVNKIATALNKPTIYKGVELLTFIVECCKTDDLLIAKEQLYTQLRIRQMQSPILVPDVYEENALNRPDEFEGRRIASSHKKPSKINDDDCRLSTSVYKRLAHGKKLKHSFYFDSKAVDLISDSKENTKAFLKKLEGYGFCNDFNSLANHEPYAKLNNKIAVVYMDGNSFSKKQRAYLNQVKEGSTFEELQDNLIEAQKDFDQQIQGKRANYLYNLLQEMTSETDSFNHAQTENKKEIRLETLLWGGDEMIFVMPAWLGFEFLHQFFKQTKDWKLKNKNEEEEEEKLTHAAGLVFCSAKTPIRNIRTLAQSLADTIKEVKSDADIEKKSPNGRGGREQNSWGYRVLESIDYPSNDDAEDFNNKFYGEALSKNKPTLIPAFTGDFNAIKKSAKALINDGLLPTSQLYKIVHAIRKDPKISSRSWEQLTELKTLPDEEDPQLNLVEEQEFRLLQTSKAREKLQKEIALVATLFSIDLGNDKTSKNRLWLWIYLYELWEYICPVTNVKGGE